MFASTSNCMLEVMKCAAIIAANIIRKSLNIFTQIGNSYSKICLFALMYGCCCSCFHIMSVYTSCYFYQWMFPEIALLSFTTRKVQWYFLPNQNLENNNFSTKLARNWMLRSEIIGILFLFSNKQPRYLSIILPFAWILLSGVFCLKCFPFSTVLLVLAI